MIHHISIPASHPQRVAEALAKIWGGTAVPFPVNPGSYMALSHDEYGTMIEVYPLGTELVPGSGEQQVQFSQNTHPSQFHPVHAAISVNTSQAQIEEVAVQEGWRVLRCQRGHFEVMEFWIENHLMLELLTPEMASQYLGFIKQRNLEQTLSGAVA